MKKTLFRQMITYLIILIIIITTLSFIAVNYFMKDYYFNQQQKILEEKSFEVIELYNNTDDFQEVQNLIDYISDKYGLLTQIYSNNGYLICGVRMNGMAGGKFIKSLLQFPNEEAFRYTTSSVQGKNVWLAYKDLMPDGNIILIRTPYQSIEQTVTIFKDFFMYLGIIIFFLAFIFIYVISKNITKPIVELNNIANEMGRMNFKLKYSGNREDEIGQLGKTFNELTNKLENTINKLQQELNKERTLEKMRKKFIATVSHELKTPLAIIESYVEALQDKLYDNEDEVYYYYNIIYNESEKMSRITQDLLDLTQLESGNFQINKNDFEYTQFIMDIFNKYIAKAKEKDIHFALIDDIKRLVYINGDRFRLEQVITNFIENAFNHTVSKGKIQIKTNINSDYLITTVYNTGQKIPEKEMPHIWDSFYKGKSFNDKKGTGLGLTICKNILELHEYKYWVKNKENGIEFGFEIKL